MLLRLIFLIILSTIPNNAGSNQSKTIDTFGSNCLIHNAAYQYEYLYSSNDYKSKDKVIHLKPLSKVNDFNKIRWSLIQTKNQSGQFYLKSSFYDDYLCSKSIFTDVYRLKRILVRLVIKPNINQFDNCKWKISKVNSTTSNSTYLITNVFYNEALFAASYILPNWVYDKEIFLTYNKNLKTSKLEWIIDCKTGNYLWI